MQVPKKNYIHLFKSKKSLIFARQKEDMEFTLLNNTDRRVIDDLRKPWYGICKV